MKKCKNGEHWVTPEKFAEMEEKRKSKLAEIRAKKRVHRMGDVRADGKMFWSYNQNCKNGEWWMSSEKFYKRLSRILGIKKEDYHKRKKYKSNNNNETPNEKRERINAYARNYAKNNRSKINDYYRKRRKEDNLYKSNISIRKAISRSFNKAGFRKGSKTEKILGCSFKEFKQHIENQFLPEMSWDNRSDWHLDHIMPASMAKTHDELIRLNHYKNFRPLWAIENIKKSNKNLDTLVLF